MRSTTSSAGRALSSPRYCSMSLVMRLHISLANRSRAGVVHRVLRRAVRGARLGGELATESSPSAAPCPAVADLACSRRFRTAGSRRAVYAAGKKSMGLLTVSGSTSAGLKRIRRTRATIFFSSSGSLSSLDTTRHIVISPDGAMVNSSTSLPGELRLLAQRAAIERVQRALVAVEHDLDFLARARSLAAVAGALHAAAGVRIETRAVLNLRRGVRADGAGAAAEAARHVGGVDAARRAARRRRDEVALRARILDRRLHLRILQIEILVAQRRRARPASASMPWLRTLGFGFSTGFSVGFGLSSGSGFFLPAAAEAAAAVSASRR